ncbi:hypothetical protein FRC00_012242 [Tulasnella sp. 408]|nr:hypothetical protein FRC00_012242 [Tulasnella sp. 408]
MLASFGNSRQIETSLDGIAFPTLPHPPADDESLDELGPGKFATKIVVLPKRSRKMALKGRNLFNVNSRAPLPHIVFRGSRHLPLALFDINFPNYCCKPPLHVNGSSVPLYAGDLGRSQRAHERRGCSSYSAGHHHRLEVPQPLALLPRFPYPERFYRHFLYQFDSHSTNDYHNPVLKLHLKSNVEREISAGVSNPSSDTLVEVDPPTSSSANVDEVITQHGEDEVHIENCQADSCARTTLLQLDAEDRATETDRNWQSAKKGGKLPEGGRRTQGSDSVSTMPMPTPTSPPFVACHKEDEDPEEEDDVDDKGFSRKDQRKAVAESRQAAITRLFYGASTSNGGKQPLFQEEWDRLEQFAPVPSSPRKVVRPPSPASTRVGPELVHCSLPPPYSDSSPVPAATPVEIKRLPRLSKLIEKIVRNPFKNRGRVAVAP